MKHEATLQQLKSEIEDLEEQEAGVQESLLDLKHELERHSTSLKDSEKKIKYYQNEVSGLALSGWGMWVECTGLMETYLLAISRTLVTVQVGLWVPTLMTRRDSVLWVDPPSLLDGTLADLYITSGPVGCLFWGTRDHFAWSHMWPQLC